MVLALPSTSALVQQVTLVTNVNIQFAQERIQAIQQCALDMVLAQLQILANVVLDM